ncbi:MAG: hypothetical protein JWO08_4674, partial [Verrucomicrobiaceae bacterium]|nr:hypothetical protein [Verrucomicrobiaceae bacterium]
MKRLLQTAIGCLGLAAISAHGGSNVVPEILIYKYTSPRPWTQYDCYRPDAASTDATPVIPLNARVGTYTQTEYWVFDKTNNVLKPVQYYSYVVNGATVKKYEVGSTDTLTRIAYDEADAPVTVPCVRYLPGALVNTYN